MSIRKKCVFMKEEISEIVYQLMNGYLMPDTVPKALWDSIPDAFRDGTVCAEWMNDIYNARMHLGGRLGTDEEDPDILTIVNTYEKIARYIGESMYGYGKMNLEALLPDETGGQPKPKLTLCK